MSTRKNIVKEESGIKRNNCCVNRWRLSEGLRSDPGWGGNQTFCKCQTGGRFRPTAEQTVLTVKLAIETLLRLMPPHSEQSFSTCELRPKFGPRNHWRRKSEVEGDFNETIEN